MTPEPRLASLKLAVPNAAKLAVPNAAKLAVPNAAKLAVLNAAKLAAIVAAMIAAVGCDTGGLLVVEQRPAVLGPSANELVSGGTFAKNGQYKLFYVVGQPTPNQGVSRGFNERVNGGLTGAVNGNR